MMLSFLLSVHAVEFAFGAVILARARGFLRAEALLYAALVVAHLLLHHEIPAGALDRFFDVAIIGIGSALAIQAFFAQRRCVVSVKA